MGPPLIANSTLVLRETLLGALKGRLEDSSELRIHASDFHTAVEQLGMSFGTKDVDEIMVMCKIGEDGYIDFEGFETHCIEARQMAKSQPRVIAKKGKASSSAAAVQPLRPGDAHKMMAEAERQTQIVRVNEDKIRELYEDFDDASINTMQFKKALTDMGLVINTDLESLLRKSECCDTSFGQILRALCVADHGNKAVLGDMGVASPQGGATSAQTNARKDDRWSGGKRTAPQKATSLISQSSADSERTDIGARGAGSRKGKFFTDSAGVTGTLDQGEPKVMFSTSRMQMLDGLTPGAIAPTGVNCEQKMLKQQIFSLVRKMDAGEITATIFQDKLFTMGFEIPNSVVQLLKNFESSGKVNFKEFIGAFDKYFDARSGESTAPPAKIEGIKGTIRACLKEKGASGVANLAKVFRDMDEDGSHSLSLSEFKKGIYGYGLELDSNDLRLLFNSFDTDGNGQLSYDEFMTAIRGEMNSQRMILCRQAFQVLDKTGTGTIDTEDVMAVYDPTDHPDVVSGMISPDEALAQFLDAFDGDDHDGHVTIGEFLNYYRNVSATIDDDEEFSCMLRTEWGLDDMPPPPPSFSRNKKGEMVNKPLAGQNHGNIISWGQQASHLEKRQEGSTHTHKVISNTLHSGGMKVNDWSKIKEEGMRALDDEFQNTAIGHRQRKNIQVKSTIDVTHWDVFDPSQKQERVKIAAEISSPNKRRQNAANNEALYGRPSPFGTDHGQKNAAKISPKSASKLKPKSMAEFASITVESGETGSSSPSNGEGAMAKWGGTTDYVDGPREAKMKDPRNILGI
jgi:Ca2+-binding EF-hand superfamily protein